ncbi:MAG: DUF2845 domain-containing protein [Myxococcota bacterium]|nr:DUF2845 domain-containing protein [Myxococcota bacterium]
MARVATVRSGLALFAAIGICALASPAAALDCGQRLVTVGDSAAHVRAVCGEPISVMTRTETRTQFVAGPVAGGGTAGSVISVTVQIDVWVYDFGRRRFMEELTFENGYLQRMRALGYGTGAGGRRGAVERGELPRDRALAWSRRSPLIVRRGA